MNDFSTPYREHLLICALVQWFDEELLHALDIGDRQDIDILLASDAIEPAEQFSQMYRLRDEARAEALEWIRTHSHFDELAIHMRAFDAFLNRMRSPAGDDRLKGEEEQCFYHLDKIFFLATPRGEWQIISHAIAQVRSAEPRSTRHLHQLVFYDGSVAIHTQEYQRAETLLSTLLQQPKLDLEVRVRVLNGLALSYMYQNTYDRALKLYEQVYALAEETSDRFYQAAALSNMSMIYNDLEYYGQALDLNMRSLAIFRDLQDHRREAIVLYEIGNNALRLGRWQVAEEHFDEAIVLCKRYGMLARLSNVYWAQGLLYHLLGHEAESERAYLEALSIAQSSEYGDQRIVDDVLWQLGFLYMTQGRWDAALEMYERAIDLALDLHRPHWLCMMRYQRGNVFCHQGRLDEAFAAYAQAIDGIEVLRGATEGEEIKIGLLGTTQQVYEAMVQLCLTLGRHAEAFDYVERARSRAFLDTLATKPATGEPEAAPDLYAALDQPVVTLAEVQDRLPADALLIEYFTIGVVPRGESLINQLPKQNARLREHLTLPPQLLIFAVTREGLEVYCPALDPNTLRPQPSDPGPGRRLLEPSRRLEQLYERLIAPIAHLLGGRRLLYVIPHGPLHYVPFTALRAASGAYLLAADGPAIARAPSATILLRNCLRRPRGRGVGALALGYNDAEGDEPLRYPEAEAQHVARVLGGEAWTGPDPKGPRLIAEGRRARWLHIAGHAVYDTADPLASYLRLGAGDALSARAILGGLELAADLVTLSACTSGLSHVVPGDELLGMQRAFLYAGAPAVVCTLWETADFVALLVMDRFYADLRRGRPAAAALRDAQVAVREMTGRDLQATIARWRADDPEFAAALGELPIVPPEQLDTQFFADPFYWAPFMLIGRPD